MKAVLKVSTTSARYARNSGSDGCVANFTLTGLSTTSALVASLHVQLPQTPLCRSAAILLDGRDALELVSDTGKRSMLCPIEACRFETGT